MTDALPAFSIHQSYPSGYHSTVFLYHELAALGAVCKFDNTQTENCEGIVINGKPVAWLLDSRIPANAQWQDPAARKMIADGKLVACCQKPDADRLGAKWLPLAVTPGYDLPDAPTGKQYGAAFVGYVNDTERRMFLGRIGAKAPLHIASGIFGAEAVAVYHQALCAVNVPAMVGAPFAYDAPNMRMFEVMATGTPLIQYYHPALHDLGVRSGVNCLTFTTVDEAVQHIKTLIADVDLGAHLATNAYRLVMGRHTYRHRAEQILEWLK